jgi:xylulose-5-phosphate/fructose-6-phosphate phosphoketolase
MRRLFKQFSFPGGIPSHVAPETPGSIHEKGELGYALAHGYGYKEEGAVTKRFDMCAMNDIDRSHLATDVLDRVERLSSVTAYVRRTLRNMLVDHKHYIDEHSADLPKVGGWVWPRAANQ